MAKRASIGSKLSQAVTTARRTKEATTQGGGLLKALAWRSGTWLPAGPGLGIKRSRNSDAAGRGLVFEVL